MKLKHIWGVFPIIIVVGIIFYFENRAFKQRKKWVSSVVESPIVQIKNNWTGGRSYDYVTKNGLIITLMNSDTLLVGDSISKEANTFKFKVYRKVDGKYQFHKNYEMKD